MSFKSAVIIPIITITSLFIIGGWFVSQNRTTVSITEIEQNPLSKINSIRNIIFHGIKINNINIDVELADTLKKKAQGLSKRKILAENQGMLFVYDTPGFYSFWMKDMQFSIDIIWIDENYNIINITKNILPSSFPQTFQSQKPAQYIFEVNAGFSDKNNIKIGDKIDFSKIFINNQFE